MKTHRPPVLTCSVCRARLGDDAPSSSLIVRVDAAPRPAGRYCGPGCLAAIAAVDAVRELQRNDEIADALLALYRRGRGPSPVLVLSAVESARDAAGIAG